MIACDADVSNVVKPENPSFTSFNVSFTTSEPLCGTPMNKTPLTFKSLILKRSRFATIPPRLNPTMSSGFYWPILCFLISLKSKRTCLLLNLNG